MRTSQMAPQAGSRLSRISESPPWRGVAEQCGSRAHDARFERECDISPDGRQVLVDSTLEEAAAEPLTVITNWKAELKE